MHECTKEFKTTRIDGCRGTGYNRCYGNENLVFEVWFMDKDGCEGYFDNWVEVDVNFCPYCGFSYQPERLNEKTSEEDTIV